MKAVDEIEAVRDCYYPENVDAIEVHYARLSGPDEDVPED